MSQWLRFIKLLSQADSNVIQAVKHPDRLLNPVWWFSIKSEGY